MLVWPITEDKFAWLRDDEFARQAVAGINPVNIESLSVFPPQSKLDPEIYGPLDSALKEEHILGYLDGMSVQQVSQTVITIRRATPLLSCLYRMLLFWIFFIISKFWGNFHRLSMRTSCSSWITMMPIYHSSIRSMRLMGVKPMRPAPSTS